MRRKNFIKYAGVGAAMTVFSTIAMILLVDYFGLWVGSANIIVITTVFIFKFILYEKVELIKSE